jgi:hypothetical protein
VKRVKLTFKGSPIGQQSKQMPMATSESSKRVLFEESSQTLRPSQRTIEQISHGQKDMTQFEWSLSYQETTSRLILILGKVMGDGDIKSGHVFSYGRVLRVDYKDDNSPNLIMKLETSKSERNISLSEGNLILTSCEPLKLGRML